MIEVKPPSLSVLIPVYNERGNIEEVIRRVSAVSFEKEIIAVDDCSTDGTYEFLRDELAPRTPELRLFRHSVNQGKGSAIRTALKEAKGVVSIIQDADLEYSPEDYPKLIEPVLKGEADVVYGSRFVKVDKLRFVWHWFLNRFFG